MRGDHSDDEWCIDLLHLGLSVSGIPVLFRVATQIETFEFLRGCGVDLTRTDEDGSSLLMETQGPFDLDVFEWLVTELADKGVIDRPDKEGFTPLSAKIKFGEIEKARILLKQGASIDTPATVARYGGQVIDIPMQAVNCHPFDGSDPQETAIEALKLLTVYGYDPSGEEVDHLLEATDAQWVELRSWILNNLTDLPASDPSP